jgi:hypothetical protein
MRSRRTHNVPKKAIPIGSDAYLCCASAGLKGSKNILIDGSRGRSDDYTLRQCPLVNSRRLKKQ